MDNRPIGIFDSGIGGLTVVNSIIDLLPGETIYYVGDTARVPYGNKSRFRIQQYSEEIVRWLIDKDCKMIIVACNTASSLAIDYLKDNFSLPILGVINPGVNYAVKATNNHSIGVLGTYSTIRSDAYGKKLRLINPRMKIISRSCPLFVPLVEEGWVEGEVPLSIARFYLEDFLNTDIDTVILGCTHYPILTSIIKKILGDKIELVDSGKSTAESVLKKLKNYDLASTNIEGDLFCFVTDSSDLFTKLASKFLKKKLTEIKSIDISRDEKSA